MTFVYRIGLSSTEVDVESLERSGLKFSVVEPRNKLLSSVKQVLGKPYKRGASVLKDAPESFDCSSLIAWASVESGISIPRIAIDQYVYSQRINKDELIYGDIIFSNTGKIIHTDGSYFSQVLGKTVKEEAIRTETLEYMPGTKVPEGVDHVGVYVDDGKVIHSSASTGGVVEENLVESNSFKNIIGYGRIIKDENRRFVVQIPDERMDLRSKENLIKEISKLSS
ncbi:MAG: NlpC/P60 family protein [Minisyncoccia bacterium]